jgi:hypothetical protein
MRTRNAGERATDVQEVIEGHGVGSDTDEKHVVENCPGFEPEGAMGGGLEQAVVDNEVGPDAFALHLRGGGEAEVEVLAEPGGFLKLDSIAVLASAWKMALGVWGVCAGKGEDGGRGRLSGEAGGEGGGRAGRAGRSGEPGESGEADGEHGGGRTCDA